MTTTARIATALAALLLGVSLPNLAAAQTKIGVVDMQRALSETEDGRKAKETLPQGKQRCRKAITAQGYTIVATVGNRKTDLSGTLTGRGFKLPSYNKKLS